jgi:trehalose/maltose transport system substrate-binding protein
VSIRPRRILLLPALALLAASTHPTHAAKPVLHVDCSFTGSAGEFCKEGAEAWSRKRDVKVVVERRTMTSTEKLARYRRLLESKSDKLDVFGLDIIWPAVLHKHLLDLEPHFGELVKEYLPLYIENNTVNGRLLAIPFNVGVGLLFYRTDLLQKHKLEAPRTWEQLTEAALQIQTLERAAGNAGFWGFVFQGKSYEGLTCNALEWIASHNGGTIVDAKGKVTVNNSNVLKAVSMAAGWMGKITPPEALGFAEAESHRFFRQGKAAFLRAWPSAWSIVTGEDSAVRDKVGVTLVPRGGEKGIHTSTLGGWSLAVARHTRHPELAAELVKYLTSPFEQKRRALVGGGGPTLTELYKDKDILKAAPYYEILVPVLAHAALRPSRITRSAYPDVSVEFWQAIHRVLQGKETPLAGMSRLQNRLEGLSKRWKSPADG